MVTYSIRELAEITGVKAHTIRAWEKRYGIIQPERSCFNVRLYNETDLQTLNNVAFLNKRGFKISKIASMNRAQIADHVMQLRTAHAGSRDKIDMLSMALMDFNASKAECIIGAHIKHDGIERTMLELIFPLLDRIGFFLVSGTMSNAHEHMLVDIVQQKLRTAIDKTPRVSSTKSSMLLFASAPRILDLQRLFVQYLARRNEVNVIPFMLPPTAEDLQRAIAARSAQYVFVLHDVSAPTTVLHHAIEVCKVNDHAQLIICCDGLQLGTTELPDGAVTLENIKDALTFFSQRAPSFL